MSQVFLSASVPLPGRGDFHETANPFLIQFAVRELLTVCLGRRLIVWGGHPAITPMVWAVCNDLGVEYAKTVKLYQSKFFEECFPEENRKFANVVYVDSVPDNGAKSLDRMRTRMLEGAFEAGVFIGGMEGVFEEYEFFRRLHPHAKTVIVDSPGGAALQLSDRLGRKTDRIDFARMFYEELSIDVEEVRKSSDVIE